MDRFPAFGWADLVIYCSQNICDRKVIEYTPACRKHPGARRAAINRAVRPETTRFKITTAIRTLKFLVTAIKQRPPLRAHFYGAYNIYRNNKKDVT